MLLKNGGDPGDKAKLFPQRSAGPGFHAIISAVLRGNTVVFLPWHRAGWRSLSGAHGCQRLQVY